VFSSLRNHDSLIIMPIVVVKGQLPGVTKQAGGLFRDNLGHATQPLQDLASYSKYRLLEKS
jgi:hypothetical protein